MANQFQIGDCELKVLLAILRTGDDAYGVSISDEIEKATGGMILLGSVYDALARLEEKCLIASSLGETTPERGDRAKRLFRVTSKGMQVAKESQRDLATPWVGLPQLRGGAA